MGVGRVQTPVPGAHRNCPPEAAARSRPGAGPAATRPRRAAGGSTARGPRWAAGPWSGSGRRRRQRRCRGRRRCRLCCCCCCCCYWWQPRAARARREGSRGRWRRRGRLVEAGTTTRGPAASRWWRWLRARVAPAPTTQRRRRRSRPIAAVRAPPPPPAAAATGAACWEAVIVAALWCCGRCAGWMVTGACRRSKLESSREAISCADSGSCPLRWFLWVAREGARQDTAVGSSVHFTGVGRERQREHRLQAEDHHQAEPSLSLPPHS